jgi:hypothetical protein
LICDAGTRCRLPRGYESAHETGDVFRKSFEPRVAWFPNESSDVV